MFFDYFSLVMDEEKVMGNPEYAVIMAPRKKKEKVSKEKKMAIKSGEGASGVSVDQNVLGLEAPNIALPIDQLALPQSGKVSSNRARPDGPCLNNNM